MKNTKDSQCENNICFYIDGVLIKLKSQRFYAMLFKRIMGFIYLSFFIGFLVYKFSFQMAGQQDAILITALVIIILMILLLAIRRILVE